MEDSPRYLSNLSVLADLYWKVDRKKALNMRNAPLCRRITIPETQFENLFEQKELAEKWRCYWNKIWQDFRLM